MSKILMTPGPTYIHESVREALKREITNPDLDIDFFEFYKSLCNKIIWKEWYEKNWFPYTQPISDLYGLDVAINRILDNNEFEKLHMDIATALRGAINEAGLELYPKSYFSNTVTSILVPDGISFAEIFNVLNNEYNILIGGGFDLLEDKIFRIGHMGENCNINNIIITLKALDEIFSCNGIYLKKSLEEGFISEVKLINSKRALEVF